MRETLETQRLRLRPPIDADVDAIVPLANDFEVVKNTASMPYPYTPDDARAYIARATERRAQGTDYAFAILKKTDNTFLGGIGVHPTRGFEFGYWLGRPFWGKGYATEAARRIVRFAFEELDAEKLTAGWFEDNPASRRVLEKLGCVPNGAEMRVSLARGKPVLSHQVVLTRDAFRRREQS